MAERCRMTLKTRAPKKRLGAAPALGMALFESLGITQMIDEACGYDGTASLSPGNAAKAICGTMFTENRRQALCNIENFYRYAPVETLFGGIDCPSCLNDTTLGRNMDSIFSVGTTSLLYNITCRLRGTLELDPKYAHLDASNITVYKSPLQTDESDENGKDQGDIPEPVRARFGKAKNGRDDLLQINFEAIVDEFGLQSYLKCHDGNKSDMTMAMDAVKHMKEFEKSPPILIADSKIVYADMVDYLADSHIPFISKCPENYGDKVRAKIVDLCRGRDFEPIGQLGMRKDSPSYEIFDTHKEVEGNTLRFIAYRCTGGKNNRSLDYYLKVGSKKMEALFGKYRRKRFNCEVDARNDILAVLPKAESFPYRIDYEVVSETHPGKRMGRGRPKKGDPAPPDVTEWRVDCTWEFDNALAERMAEDYNIRVIVTSVPKADETCENPGKGATGMDILKLYLNQYVVEHSFREYKSGLGADTLFFQSTARMEVLLFLIALGTIVRNLVKILLRRNGSGCRSIPKNITALKLFRTLTNMLIESDPVENSIVLDGDEDDTDLLLISCELLGLVPERLLG